MVSILFFFYYNKILVYPCLCIHNLFFSTKIRFISTTTQFCFCSFLFCYIYKLKGMSPCFGENILLFNIFFIS